VLHPAYSFSVVFMAGVGAGAGLTMMIQFDAVPRDQSSPSAQVQSPPVYAAIPRSAMTDAFSSAKAVRLPVDEVSKPIVQPRKDDRTDQGFDLLVRYPPPHVVDADFFGPTVDADEAERLRQEALNELVVSMRAAELPEADIDALLQYRSASATVEDPMPGDDPAAVPPDPVDQANELLQSLRSAGVPEADIEVMVGNLFAAEVSAEWVEDAAGPQSSPPPPVH
jgi:hypothetical protein